MRIPKFCENCDYVTFRLTKKNLCNRTFTVDKEGCSAYIYQKSKYLLMIFLDINDEDPVIECILTKDYEVLESLDISKGGYLPNREYSLFGLGVDNNGICR